MSPTTSLKPPLSPPARPVALPVVLSAALVLALAVARAQDAPPAPPLPAGTAAEAGAAAPATADARTRVFLPVVEVVVYEDRALVTREGEVPLAGGGVETIVIGGLPATLRESSLRAGIGDASRGRVLSLASDVERKREIQDTRLRAVEADRRALERKLLEARDEASVLDAREKFLAAYEKVVAQGISERTGGGGETETGLWTEALQFLQRERSSIQDARRIVQDREARLQEESATLGAEVARLSSPQERSTRNAEVVVEAAAAGRAVLRLSYVIEGAGWTPRYDVRQDLERGDLLISYQGEVRQKTGEDWPDARLILSTARPSVGASRPKLSALRLTSRKAPGKGEEHFVARAGEPAAVAGRVELDADGAAAEAAPSDDLAGPGVAPRENATSATFTVAGQSTIPTDGRPHKVTLATFREKAELSFESVPRLARFVYLKASARNGSPYPLLAGLVDIHRGSGFMGTGAFKFTPPGGPFEVSLGIEESLKVRRVESIARWEDRGRVRHEAYDIEVANFGEALQRVVVKESVPISDVEEVVVTVDSSTTKPTRADEKSGVREWSLDVPAGGTRAVRLEFTVRYPRSQTGE